jgi:hypothetical protein
MRSVGSLLVMSIRVCGKRRVEMKNMLLDLKKKIKANDSLSSVLRYFYVPVVLLKKLKFDYQAKARAAGKDDTRYEKLRNFKNIHKGKRCFIVATGPSLTIEDIELLRDEFTFSMNSIYISYSDTTWRPTYYVIQDPLVYEKIQQFIEPTDYKEIFIGSIINKKIEKHAARNVHEFPLDLLWQQIPNKKYHTKFSEDIYSRVFSGYNVAYSALQIAVYMGFSEIYLIGADCNYLSDKRYFAEDKNRGSEKYFTKKFYASNTDKFILAYEVAKKYADAHNVRIYNATRGGLLEVYPRVKLNEVLK